MSSAPTAAAPPDGASHDLRAARVVALGMLVSKPSGYARDALLAARFGGGAALDAYTLASAAAGAVFDAIGTPLQRVLAPVLVRAREQRGAAGLAATSAAVLWAAALLAVLLGAGLLAAAGPVSALLAGGGPARAQTAELIRWLSLLPLAMALAAYATAWLQAAERFTLPAFVGLPLDLSIIAFVVFARGHGILAAAWGLLAGYLGEYLLQWPGLRRWGHRVRLPAPRAAAADPGLRATIGMAVPLWVSAGAFQATQVLQQALAARLPVGGVAALAYAYRVLDLPSALFILPAVTVVLPRLAALVADGRADAADAVLGEAGWALTAGLLPCALLLALLAHPLCAALYEHGAFGAKAVAAMAACLVGFAPGVLTYGMQQLVRTAFYARQDARTPMIWDVAALVTAAAFDLVLYRALGGFGLALGWSLGAGVAWVGLARAAGAAHPGRAWPYLRALAAGSAALVAVVLALHGHVAHLGGRRVWTVALGDVAERGAAGAAAYLAVMAAAGGRPMLAGLAGRIRVRARRASAGVVA